VHILSIFDFPGGIMTLRRIFLAGLIGCTMLAGCNGGDDKSPPADTTSQGTYDQLRAEIDQLKDALGKKDEENQQTFAALKTALAQLQALGLGELKAEIAALQARVSATEAGLKALDAISAHLDKIDAALNALDAKTLSNEDRARLGALHNDFAVLKADYDAAVKLAGEPASTTTLTKLLEGLGSGKADKTLIDNLQKALNELTLGFDKAKLGTEKSAEDIGKRIAELEAAIDKLTGEDLTQYVNQFVGTADAAMAEGAAEVPMGKGGSLFPGAGMPFGMVYWAPDNYLDQGTWPRGYYWSNNGKVLGIKGFSLMHMQGAGCDGNGGEFPVVPLTGPSFDLSSGLPFKHENESAHAGYYQVKLDSNVNVELTATARTGFGRFTYPAGRAYLMIDPTRTNNRRSSVAGSVIQVSGSSRAVTGKTITGGFCIPWNGDDTPEAFLYAEFNKDFKLVQVNNKPALEFTVEPGKETEILMKVGVSFVSEENAKRNLEKESIKEWNFNEAHEAAKNEWNKKLGVVKVDWDKTRNDDYYSKHKSMLYSYLYRTLLAPAITSDVDGRYMGFDRKIKQTDEGKVQYTNYSGWDIYRSLVPLQALFFPKEAGDMAQSLVNMGKVCGALPRWVNYSNEKGVMAGDSGPIIVAQAYAFGGKNFDTKTAKELMINASDDPVSHCQGKSIEENRTEYLLNGYSGSRALELAAGDFAVGNFAGALGDEKNKERLLARSQSWKNQIVMRGAQPTLKSGEMVEGSSEQYIWMTLHDLGGLVETLGGAKATSDRLDKFFTHLNSGTDKATAYLGNEPSFGSPWVYNWTQNPSGTQKVVRRMIGDLPDTSQAKDAIFNLAPQGLAGNDDLGSISAMYVWGALGIYPEIPGEGGFSLHSPLFPKTILSLADGETRAVFKADAAPDIFIQRLTLNGVQQDSTWLAYKKLVPQAGGNTFLDFTLGKTPSAWGTLATPAVLPLSPANGRQWRKPEFRGVHAAYNNCGIGGLGTSCVTTSMFVPTPNDSIYSNSVPASSYDGTTLKLADPASEGLKLVAGLFDPLPLKERVHEFGRDNIISYGQTITFDKPLKGNTLFVLGAGSKGEGQGSATLTFADGTTSTVDLALPDWTDDASYTAPTTAVKGTSDGEKLAAYVADQSKGDGYRVVYEAEGRLKWSGDKQNAKGRIYYQAIKLAGPKEITSIVLPEASGNSWSTQLHIFGINAAGVTY
jgi:predicted alpha-1,2-mannosidase